MAANLATASIEPAEPVRLSHDEFVAGLRAGRVSFSVDTLPAYRLASSRSNALVWWVTGYMQLILNWPVVSLVIIVLAFVFHNAWVLLAIPAAIIGPPGMLGLDSYRIPPITSTSPEARAFVRRLWRSSRWHRIWHPLLAVGAVVGLAYAIRADAWKSPLFLTSSAFLLTFVECVVYHIVCKRAFFSMLMQQPEFYSEAASRGVISVDTE